MAEVCNLAAKESVTMAEKIGFGGIERSSRVGATDTDQGSPEQGWRGVGQFRRLEEIESYCADPSGLIILTTGNGSKVCPEKQFIIREDQDGEERLCVDPYVKAVWDITSLADLSEWSRAARIFMPLQGRDKSYVDEVLDPGATYEDKLEFLKHVMADEEDRAANSADPDFEDRLDKVFESNDFLAKHREALS